MDNALDQAQWSADHWDPIDKTDQRGQQTIVFALLAIAQELRRLNERAEQEARSRPRPKLYRQEGEPRTLS